MSALSALSWVDHEECQPSGHGQVCVSLSQKRDCWLLSGGIPGFCVSGGTRCGQGAVRVLGHVAGVPRGLWGTNGLPLQSGAHIWTDILPAHSCPLSSGRQEGLL